MGALAQSEHLPCKHHKDLSSIPRGHILKKLSMVLHAAYNPSNAEDEGWSLADSKLQAREKDHLENQGGEFRTTAEVNP